MADLIARPSSKPTAAEIRRAKRRGRIRKARARLRAFFNFHFNSFSKAFSKAWIWALAVSAAITILVPTFLYFSGIGLSFSQEREVNHLYIQIPALFFIVLFAIMLFYVPFSKHETLQVDLETQRGIVGQYASDLSDANYERSLLEDQRFTLQEQLKATSSERDSLKSQLDSSYKVVLDVDTVGCSAEVNLPQRSRVNFIPVPGDDGEWATGSLLADVRMRFDSRSETTRVRINSVVAFMVIGTSQRLISDINYFVGEGWDSVDFENEAYSHVEPLKKSPYYLMSCSCDLSADEVVQLSQNVGILRLVMDAANQPNYCVDLAISTWDEIETSTGSAVTVLKKGGCPS
jgi:hypothetical protein